MKHYLACLLLLTLPFTIVSCGGSSGGDDQESEQVAEPGNSKTAPAPESTPQIYTYSDDSSVTPNVAFATDDEMIIVLGPDVEGGEMPLKSMIMQKDGVGSLLVEFSANGMPSAFITRDGTVKINRYSYAEGKWFIHFSVNQAGSVTDHTVELPQSFGEYVSNLDSWMRSRSEAVNQLSTLSKQDQSKAVKDSIAIMLEVAAVGIEMGVCAGSTVLGPGVMFWACQSAVSTTVDFIEDGQLSPPAEMDYQKCLFSVGAEGIHMGDPVCLLTTGLRLASEQLRGDTPDTSEMEDLADKSMDQNRYIGEDPVIEDFPTPLLTAPQLAVLSPQWLESFSTEQDVPIKVAASEGIDVVNFEVRSSDTGAVLVSGDTQASFTGEFEIKIESGTLEAGRYFLSVSASNGELSTETYSSLEITSNTSSWRGTLRITEETHVSGEDPNFGKYACQNAFSIIGRAELVPVVYDLSMPKISGKSAMRVDSTFGGANNSPYCTQAPIEIKNNRFTYVAIRPFYDRGDTVFPRLENSFNFQINEESESSLVGTMSATASFDTSKGWHTGSCTAEFALEKVETRAFKACDASETFNICQPGSEHCEWSNP